MVRVVSHTLSDDGVLRPWARAWFDVLSSLSSQLDGGLVMLIERELYALRAENKKLRDDLTMAREHCAELLSEQRRISGLAMEAYAKAEVASERERCAKVCDALAVALKIAGGEEWTPAQRDAGTVTAAWLRDEIRKGE